MFLRPNTPRMSNRTPGRCTRSAKVHRGCVFCVPHELSPIDSKRSAPYLLHRLCRPLRLFDIPLGMVLCAFRSTCCRAHSLLCHRHPFSLRSCVRNLRAVLSGVRMGKQGCWGQGDVHRPREPGNFGDKIGATRRDGGTPHFVACVFISLEPIYFCTLYRPLFTPVHDISRRYVVMPPAHGRVGTVP